MSERFRLWRDEVFGIDLAWLATFRIGLGLLLLADLVFWGSNLEMHLTDRGVLPRDVWLAHFPELPTLHTLTGSGWGQALGLGVGVLSAVAFTLGWRTRLANLACWLFWMSLQHRNPMILNGGDEVMRLLLFWSLFLPLGARHSLDARAGRGAAWRDVDTVCHWASAALLIQVALIYPVTAILKVRFEVWQKLDFIREAMRVDGVATDFGRWLATLPDGLTTALAWSSLQLEAFGVLLLFSPVWTRPLRLLGAVSFMAFHAFGIGTTFAIGLFPWVMVVAWWPFLPSRPLWPPFADRPSLRVERSEPRWRSAVIALLLFGVFVHNAAHLDWLSRAQAAPATTALTVVRLDQRWGLWTSVMYNRHYVIAARTALGRTLDLHRDGAPLDWLAASPTTWNTRYWKHLLHLSKKRAKTLREPFTRSVAERWNRRHPEEPIVRVELWMLRETTPGEFRPLLLWSEDGRAQLVPPGESLFRRDAAVPAATTGAI